jgi:hypothetical protein
MCLAVTRSRRGGLSITIDGFIRLFETNGDLAKPRYAQMHLKGSAVSLFLRHRVASWSSWDRQVGFQRILNVYREFAQDP